MIRYQKPRISVIIVKFQAKEMGHIKIQDMESHQHSMDIQDFMTGMEMPQAQPYLVRKQMISLLSQHQQEMENKQSQSD